MFANERFAALCVQTQPETLIGKSMADLVHPDYRDLVAEHLRRVLSASPGLDRLEVELQLQRDQTLRVELSAVRIDYQEGAALMLTVLEMGPARGARSGCSPAAGRRRGTRSIRSARV